MGDLGEFGKGRVRRTTTRRKEQSWWCDTSVAAAVALSIVVAGLCVGICVVNVVSSIGNDSIRVHPEISSSSIGIGAATVVLLLREAIIAVAAVLSFAAAVTSNASTGSLQTCVLIGDGGIVIVVLRLVSNCSGRSAGLVDTTVAIVPAVVAIAVVFATVLHEVLPIFVAFGKRL